MKKKTPETNNQTTTTSTPVNNPTTSSTFSAASIDITELQIEDVRVGDGQEAKTGDIVVVNYKGSLVNGTVFDSSYDRGEPFSFQLGAGRVITGWDQGLIGMKVGGKRILRIPSEMGYGNQAVGPIPANSDLIFEVELVAIQ